MKTLFFIIALATTSCNLISSKKKTDLKDKEKPKLAQSHLSGDLCNALHIKSPIIYPKVPIGTAEQIVIKIFIEKRHELRNLTGSGLYEPISFYGGQFPGVFPENGFKPCSNFLSSADEAANYCHIRLNFNPHQRQSFQRTLNLRFNINGKSCSRSVRVQASGF